MENKLKTQSTATIEELKAADMRIVMVTGNSQRIIMHSNR